MVIGGKHFGQYTYEHWFDDEYGNKTKIDVFLKPEEEKDYNSVENLTREAFWNVYMPGCDEHLLIHNMRKAKEFIKELDYVAVFNDEIIANIVYAKTKIFNDNIEHDVITFGPVSVLPIYQRKGIGKKLIEHTITKAQGMGYKAIIIYGNPKYYERFGFKNSREYKITDMEGNYHDALLALELRHNSLEKVSGKFFEGEVYKVDKKELEIFEKNFPKKEKLVLPTQIFK